METKTKWIIINLVLPFIPIVLRGVERVLMGHFDFEVVSSAELFFVLGIIALLTLNDLKNQTVLMDNEDKKKERHDKAAICLLQFIIFIFFSAVAEFFHISVNIEKNINHVVGFQALLFASVLSAIWHISFCLETQREYSLTSKFI